MGERVVAAMELFGRRRTIAGLAIYGKFDARRQMDRSRTKRHNESGIVHWVNTRLVAWAVQLPPPSQSKVRGG